MNPILQEKVREAFTSVLPITVIVLVASIVLAPISGSIMLLFLAGAALLVLGMGFFTLGVDMAMMPMGEGIGAQLNKTHSLILSLIIGFVMGLVITMADPDLRVLIDQLAATGIGSWTLMLIIGIGVGLMVALAVMRVLLHIPLNVLLIVLFALIFALAGIMMNTPSGSFITAAFDAGGVTTGPIIVPFVMALCLGLASLRGDSQDDSFGFVALSSCGPIIAVMILGLVMNISQIEVAGEIDTEVIAAYTVRDIVMGFLEAFPAMLRDIAVALAAMLGCFVVFQVLTRRYKKLELLKIGIGFVYTYIGLVLFLVGVNTGFLPVGQLFGTQLGQSAARWLVVPIGMVIGYFIVQAEPAVLVLKKQVEEVTQGAIPEKLLGRSLSISMAIALGLTMLRILTAVNLLWFLLPCYALALGLSFFVPKVFTGMAFDAGGVCSGPMTSTFLLPMAMGVCAGVGGDILADAFGIVSIVAVMPIVVVQFFGLVYGLREGRLAAAKQGPTLRESGIVYYDLEFRHG